MRKWLLVYFFSFPLLSLSQSTKFIVRFSEPLAVFKFIQNLGQDAPPNSYKTIFTSSRFNVDQYKNLIQQFDAIPLDYSYEFPTFPHKNAADITSLLKQNMILSSSLHEFKDRSIGLIPLDHLNQMIALIETFTPVYKELVFDSSKAVFQNQLAQIEQLLGSKNIATYFELAKKFYRSSWDSTLAFNMIFYPLPNSIGFTATAYNNFAESAIPTSLTDYNAVLSVMLHEIAHILCDEEPAAFQVQLRKWFDQHPSKYSGFARALLQESWATAVGNGYFAEKLSGKLNPGSWYNFKYISMMAKAVFPKVKEYMDAGRGVDEDFVNHYIKLYEDSFSHWVREMPYLMASRDVISDTKADFDTLNRTYRYWNNKNYYNDFSLESFEKLKKGFTKFIIVSSDNKNKLKLVQKNFPELKDWRPDIKKDFTYLKFLSDKTVVVIINLVTVGLSDQLKKPIEIIEP